MNGAHALGQRAVAALLARLCAEHGLPLPRLEWSPRMISTLGQAYYGEWRIRMSAWLSWDQADDTVRHELAHLAAGYQRGRPPHGREWRSWAARLGAVVRARAGAPPVFAPRRELPQPLCWALQCPACGVRLARFRVRAGLYHVPCGPRRGKLHGLFRAPRQAVLAWAAR